MEILRSRRSTLPCPQYRGALRTRRAVTTSHTMAQRTASRILERSSFKTEDKNSTCLCQKTERQAKATEYAIRRHPRRQSPGPQLPCDSAGPEIPADNNTLGCLHQVPRVRHEVACQLCSTRSRGCRSGWPAMRHIACNEVLPPLAHAAPRQLASSSSSFLT